MKSFVCLALSFLLFLMPARSFSGSVSANVRTSAPTDSGPAPAEIAIRQYRQQPEIVVTTTADPFGSVAPGSLRAAVNEANSAGGGRNIVFRLSASDPNFDPTTGAWTIRLSESLRINTDNNLIDGLSQNATPSVFLDVGSFQTLANEGLFGVIVRGDGNWIRGFLFIDSVVRHFGGIIIRGDIFRQYQRNRISNCRFGLSADGNALVGNLDYGIRIVGESKETIIDANDFCCSTNGIETFGPETVIRNNRFGTNSQGTRRLPITYLKLPFTNFPDPPVAFNTRSARTVVENNIIAGNQSGGIGVVNITDFGGIDDPQDTYSSTESVIRNNRVGVGPNGENIAPDPNDPEARFATGIYAGNGDQVTGNIVANFGGAGIFARASTGRADLPPTQISGNTITNCGMGVQAAHLVGVRVTGNTITDCTRGGIVVTDVDVDAASTQSTKLPNPFRQPTRQVSIFGNTFTGTTPAVALTADARDLYAGRYAPNQRTVPEDGPNNFQPSPVLVSALRQPDGRIIVTGRAAGAGTLHVHKPEPGKLSPVADVPTDAAAFTSTLPADKAAGLTTISATVTVGGETSEFGNTIQVRDDDPPPPDTQKPTVAVLSPATGLVVESRAGASVAVTWTSADNVGVVNQSVRLTGKRNGQTFTETVMAGLPGTASSFTLTVRPDDAVADAQIVVEARDAAANVGEGRSGLFTITAPAPADTQKPTVSNVLLSKKKIVRKTDSTVIISWQSADNVGVVAHDVAFSADGTTFSVVVAAGLPGDMKAFTWTVPDKATLPKTKTGVVRVTARDAAGNIGTATSTGVTIK